MNLGNMHVYLAVHCDQETVKKTASEKGSQCAVLFLPVGFGVIHCVDCSRSLHIGYKCLYENEQHTKLR